MASKSSISKAKTKAKNEYTTGLINDFKKIQDGTLKSTDINLKTIKASEAIKLIGQNITGQRLFLKLDNNEFLLNFNNNIFSNFINNEIIKMGNIVTIRLLENSDSFSENEWNQLYKLSKETFVEENDSLKETAAGAGLIDND